jgi:hypothetical protein
MHQPVPARSHRFLPVFLGAGILAAVAGFRAAITVVIALITGNWVRVGTALVIVVIAAAGGAAGGLVYVYMGGRLRKLPIAGPYVAGIATVGSCLAVMLLLFVRIERGVALRFSETDNWVAFMLGTLVGGIVLGHTLFRDAYGRN